MCEIKKPDATCVFVLEKTGRKVTINYVPFSILMDAKVFGMRVCRRTDV
jgi:hypothetical protein